MSEMIHAIGFIVCNIGHKPTFQRGPSESIIDITFALPMVSNKIQNREVLNEGTKSDHNYIRYVLDESIIVTQPKLQGWVISKLDVNKLEAVIDVMPSIKVTGINVEESAHEFNENLRDICEKAMPKKNKHRKRKSVY